MKPFFTTDSHFVLSLLTSVAGLEDALFFQRKASGATEWGPIVSKRWYC